MNLSKKIFFPFLFLLDRFFFSGPRVFIVLNLMISCITMWSLFPEYPRKLVGSVLCFVAIGAIYFVVNFFVYVTALGGQAVMTKKQTDQQKELIN